MPKDKLVYVGDHLLNLNYWDCECSHPNYIHNAKEHYCTICGCLQDESPNSLQLEVECFRERGWLE
jgi:hypothetical protein